MSGLDDGAPLALLQRAVGKHEGRIDGAVGDGRLIETAYDADADSLSRSPCAAATPLAKLAVSR